MSWPVTNPETQQERQEKQEFYRLMKVTDPTTKMPALTTMLFRVCNQDEEKMKIASRICGLFERTLPASHFTHSQFWDCDDSITGKCVYTNDMDCCIFCNEPDERK